MDPRFCQLLDFEEVPNTTSAAKVPPAPIIIARVRFSDAITPGVVSLPHDWGHNLPGVQFSVASQRPGVHSNDLLDDRAVDPPVARAC